MADVQPQTTGFVDENDLAINSPPRVSLDKAAPQQPEVGAEPDADDQEPEVVLQPPAVDQPRTSFVDEHDFEINSPPRVSMEAARPDDGPDQVAPVMPLSPPALVAVIPAPPAVAALPQPAPPAPAAAAQLSARPSGSFWSRARFWILAALGVGVAAVAVIVAAPFIVPIVAPIVVIAPIVTTTIIPIAAPSVALIPTAIAAVLSFNESRSDESPR